MEAHLNTNNSEHRQEEQDDSNMQAELEKNYTKDEAQRADNRSESAHMNKTGGAEQQVVAADGNQDGQDDALQQAWSGQQTNGKNRQRPESHAREELTTFMNQISTQIRSGMNGNTKNK